MDRGRMRPARKPGQDETVRTDKDGGTATQEAPVRGKKVRSGLASGAEEAGEQVTDGCRDSEAEIVARRDPPLASLS
jgi:hypothetical protein